MCVCLSLLDNLASDNLLSVMKTKQKQRSQVLVPNGVSKGCDVVSVEREKRRLITGMFGQSMGVSKNDNPFFAGCICVRMCSTCMFVRLHLIDVALLLRKK